MIIVNSSSNNNSNTGLCCCCVVSLRLLDERWELAKRDANVRGKPWVQRPCAMCPANTTTVAITTTITVTIAANFTTTIGYLTSKHGLPEPLLLLLLGKGVSRQKRDGCICLSGTSTSLKRELVNLKSIELCSLCLQDVGLLPPTPPPLVPLK